MSGTFKDSRDQHEYKWVRIGKQVWMAENLAYLPDLKSEIWVYGYDDQDISEARVSENYVKYGCLYGGETATSINFGNGKDICPQGWHLPSESEWEKLEIFLGMSEKDVNLPNRNTGDVDIKLKSTSGWLYDYNGDNSSGFNALPGGFKFMKTYGGIGIKASFWTSTVYDLFAVSRELNLGIHRGDPYRKETAYSVRCIKD